MTADVKPTEERDRPKYAAGVKAIETYFRDGMVVGLGSGTTSHWMVRALAPRVLWERIVAAELAAWLNVIPGVVENGLFVDVADAVVFGHADGAADVEKL